VDLILQPADGGNPLITTDAAKTLRLRSSVSIAPTSKAAPEKAVALRVSVPVGSSDCRQPLGPARLRFFSARATSLDKQALAIAVTSHTIDTCGCP
jgi:hypothetical protein